MQVRDRLLRFQEMSLEFRTLIPEDLNLNHSNPSELREKHTTDLQKEMEQHENDNLQSLDILQILALSVKNALLLIEDHETNILIQMKNACETASEETQRLKFKTLCDEYAAVKEQIKFTDDELLIFADNIIKIICIILTPLFIANTQPPLKILETMMIYAIFHAVNQRKEMLSGMPNSFLQHEPTPHQINSIIRRVTKSILINREIKMWKSFLEEKKSMVRSPTPKVGNAEWNQFAATQLAMAKSLLQTAKIYDDQELDADALEYYQKALHILLIVEPHSLTVVKCYNAIAEIYHKSDEHRDIQKAINLYKLALDTCKYIKIDIENRDAIYKAKFSIKSKIGLIYFELGEAYFTKSNPKSSPDIINNAYNSDNLTYATHMKEKTKRYHANVLNKCSKVYGFNSKKLAECNDNLGSLFLSINQFNMAKKYFSEALRIYKLYDDEIINQNRINDILQSIKEQSESVATSSSTNTEMKFQPQSNILIDSTNPHRLFFKNQVTIEEHKHPENKSTAASLPLSKNSILNFLSQLTPSIKGNNSSEEPAATIKSERSAGLFS